MSSRNLSLLILVCLSLTGCSENPLLGTWKVKPGQSALATLCPEIKFDKKTSRCGGLVEDVKYEVNGQFVYVSSPSAEAFGFKLAYEVLDRNTMVLEMPMLGKVTYGRYSY